MKQLTDSNFQEIFNSNNLTIIDFWGQWCSPCARLKPIVEKLALKYPQIEFYEANIEENLTLRKQLKIMSLPTLIFFKDGDKLEHVTGFRSEEELENIIKKYM